MLDTAERTGHFPEQTIEIPDSLARSLALTLRAYARRLDGGPPNSVSLNRR